MQPETETVAIIGGGIAGLTAAYFLKQHGVSFRLFEAKSHLGGKIRTEHIDGYLVEHGPNSLQTNSIVLDEVVESLGLREQVVVASPEAKKRFVVLGGMPEPLPMSPPAFIRSNFFSWGTKLRILREPFTRRQSGAEEESVAGFTRRRFGAEVLKYAVDPFVTGIFAGDPESLSLQHAFPQLYGLESNYGSVLRGLMAQKKSNDTPRPKRQIFSFKEGMSTLIDALASDLSSCIETMSQVTSIFRKEGQWRIGVGDTRELHFDAVICSIPLPALKNLTASFLEADSPLWNAQYPPVSILALGFRREDVDHPLDGFGMLVPGCESPLILGTIFSSSIFPGRAPQDRVLLTTLVGGARRSELTHFSPGELLDFVLADLHKLLGVQADPVFTRQIDWQNAIPQYNLGYGAVKDAIDDLEAQNPGLFFAGNYRDGISVSDALNSGIQAASNLRTMLA